MLSLALLTRLCVVWYALVHFPSSWFYTRGMEMGLLAGSLVHGAGLSSPFGPATGPTAMITPGYPLFVAVIFRLFGVESPVSSTVIMGVHILLNLLTVWLILRLSRRIAGERAAVLVGIFWSCSLPLLWMPTIFWETSFSTCILVGFVAMALDLRSESGTSAWLVCGAYCGLAGLFNPALLPSLLMMLAWQACATSRRNLRRPLLGFLLFLLVYSPWPIRNARVFHAWIPTRTTVGLELWMGNHQGSTGFLDESLFPTFNPAELRLYQSSGEVRYTGEKEKEAESYIRTHPYMFAKLTVQRTLRFWMGSGSRNGSAFFVVHAVLTTLLGAVGLFLLLHSAERGIAPLLLIPLVLFPVPYYLTHAEFRYRLVLDPILCVLAAKAAAWLLAFRDRDARLTDAEATQ